MRVCVIGVGRMGRRHITAARNAGFELGGIFDQSAEALVTTLTECNVDKAPAFDDAGRMLQAVRPDAVVISTTPRALACAISCARSRWLPHWKSVTA